MLESTMFDVFLAHNSVDQPQVKAIAEELRKRGLKPWFDEEQIAPGRSFQEEIQLAISQVKSAAIFIGLEGLGRWQVLELRSFMSLCVNKNIPVIPVLLPGVDQIPDNLLFLQEFRWISCETIDDIAYNIEWGITGVRPDHNNQSISYPQIELQTSRGVDYTKLRDFLKQQKWQEANEETGEIMLQILSKENEGWIKSEDIDILPCDTLHTIDQLWIKASFGHFGFSVQKQIWKDVGGNLEENDYEIYKKFGEIVGWYDRDRDHWKWSKYLTFSLNSAQKGHLPRLKFKMVLNTTLLSQLTLSIFSRYETCCSGEVELKSEKGIKSLQLTEEEERQVPWIRSENQQLPWIRSENRHMQLPWLRV